MSENSKIEWTDHTFNPWRGCTKVSPGCANCYAETLSKRNPKVLGEWGKGKPRVRASAAMWREPLKWQLVSYKGLFRQCPYCSWRGEVMGDDMDCPTPGCEGDSAEMITVRPRVFCASLADWLDEEVPIEWLADLMGLIALTRDLDWLLLSKRPQNWESRLRAVAVHLQSDMATIHNRTWHFVNEWLPWNGQHRFSPPDNVWIGTTVEDQMRADERIPQLLQIPAKVRFLSCEPLLGPVDLSSERFIHVAGYICATCGGTREITDTNHPDHPTQTGDGLDQNWCMDCVGGGNRLECIVPGIHWVICGGESGPQARPMHPDWARSLRDQCAAAGVPFLFKQWGEFAPDYAVIEDGSPLSKTWRNNAQIHHCVGGDHLYRVGKKRAARLLDGKEHNAFPL